MSMERIIDIYQEVLDLSLDPKQTRWLFPLLLAADTLFCALIVWKVPCKLLLALPLSILFISLRYFLYNAVLTSLYGPLYHGCLGPIANCLYRYGN